MSPEWKDEFLTGFPRIDEQHKEIYRFINQLGEELQRDDSTITVEETLDVLSHYAEVHFKLEETCMARHNCPAAFENEEAHRHFLNFIAGFKASHQNEGHNVPLLGAIHATVEKWLNHHIGRIDIQLKGYAGKPPHTEKHKRHDA